MAPEQVTSDEIAYAVTGKTVANQFLETVAANSDRIALRERDENGAWSEWSYAGYAQDVAAAAGGMRVLGLLPGEPVVLMLRNIAAFHILDMASVFAGATPISVYNSSSPEQIAHVVAHSGATMAVVENSEFADRFAEVSGQMPKLKDVVNLETDGLDRLFNTASYDLEEGAAQVYPSSLATIIYTSGTTGPPKGVALSHYNITWTGESLFRALEERVDLDGARLVSYLPMAHIAERMVGHYTAIRFGCEVSCCPDPTGLRDYLAEVKPNLIFGVPRVWEKMAARVNAVIAEDPDRKSKFDDAVEAAVPIAQAKAWDEATEDQNGIYDFLDAVAFGPLRERVGATDLKLAVSGAAAISPELLQWYRAVGIPMSEIYGMSESTGPIAWAPHRIKPGTVGPPIPGCEVRLADDGEILFRGGNVFVGYFDDPERTAEVIDREGWMHTGDIGEFDDEGYLKVIDRKKELLITTGGKNISPANLEAALKAIPLVGQACAIGDQRPFVAALVVLDVDAAPGWAAEHGIEDASLEALAQNPVVVEEIEAAVAKAMEAFSNAERVKKVLVLGEEWLPDTEVLTPTSKLKRRGVLARYAKEIDSLYA